MTIKKKKIERVRITCLTSEREKAWEWLKKHGFVSTLSHPRIIRSAMRIDGDHYVIEGERPL